MNNKTIFDEIVIPYHIMNSDEDQTVVIDLGVGCTRKGELIIYAEYTDYENPRYDCVTWVTLSNTEARRLARRLDVSFVKLPKLISDSMDEWSYIVNPTLTQVRDCFKEITECLLDEGSRFRIHRTIGYRNFICC